MKVLPLLPLIVVLAPCALAQSPSAGGVDRVPLGSSWTFGGAVMLREGIYAGEDANIIPLPYIGYEAEKFYVRGLSAGYHLLNSETFSIDAEVSARPGVSRDDFGAADLAANGLDISHLEDRDWAADAGISASLRLPVGELKLQAKTDIMDASGGQELGLFYEHPIFMGQTMITPSIGARYLSEDMANYYYGTLDSEVARGAIDYKPGALTIPQVGVSVFHSLDEKWTVFGIAEYALTPDEMKQSPLMDREKDGYASILFGIGRRF